MKRQTEHLSRKNLVELAKSLAHTNDWVGFRTISRISKSWKYKPGQVVFPCGYGWGAVVRSGSEVVKYRWDEKHYFISSYRIKGNGLYAVLDENGKVRTFTNIRLPNEKR